MAQQLHGVSYSDEPTGTIGAHIFVGVGFLSLGFFWFCYFVRTCVDANEMRNYTPRAIQHVNLIMLFCAFTIIGTVSEVWNGNFFRSQVRDGSHFLYARVQTQDNSFHHNVNNLQHIQQYFTYFLTAIFSYLEDKHPNKVPPFMGLASLSFSFLVGSFAWFTHALSKSQPQQVQHDFLAVFSFFLFLTCTAEVCYRSIYLLAVRAYWTVVYGCWLLTIAVFMGAGFPLDVAEDSMITTKGADEIVPSGVFIMANATFVVFEMIFIACIGLALASCIPGVRDQYLEAASERKLNHGQHEMVYMQEDEDSEASESLV